MSGLNEEDIVLWSERQGELLRRLAAGEHVNDEVDWQNLAEEIEALARSESRELASRVATILEHLMKLQASSALEPQAGWRSMIRRERREIERLLADSPGLRRTVSDVVQKELAGARAAVQQDLADRGEPLRVDPTSLSYSEEQVLGS